MYRQLKDISIVIPCMNEAVCIQTLYNERSQVMAQYSCPYELLFMDDGLDSQASYFLPDSAGTVCFGYRFPLHM